MKQLALILDNIRSAHNVGAIIRNAAAFGVADIFCCGITPYPYIGSSDIRLPHIAHTATEKIAKTSLGGEQICTIAHFESTIQAIESLPQGSTLYALEIEPNAHDIASFEPEFPCALILGNEVEGISQTLTAQCDAVVSIPTTEAKRSLNVASASAVALFHFASCSSS